APPLLEPVQEELPRENADPDLQEGRRPSPPHGEHGRDREPDQSLATDPRQTFEDRVQPPDPVVDGPSLELPVVAHRPAWPMSCGGGKPARSEWGVPPSLWRRGLVGE